jgi:Uma2 family endonuclease
MVRALPDDGNRYELVEPSGLARVASPGEIEIQPKLHLEPDLLVFPALYPLKSTWTQISGWWLAVEVLSPQSKFYDRDYKRDAYLAAGVQEM